MIKSATAHLLVWLLTLGMCCSAAAQTAKPLFSLPNCMAYAFPIALSSESGKVVTGPKGGRFCTSADFSSPLSERSEVLRALKGATSGRTVSAVITSSYLYAEPGFAEWLCSLNYAADAGITLLAQRTSDGSGRVSQAFSDAMASCTVAPRFIYFGCDVFDAESLTAGSGACSRGRVNILHLKSAYLTFTDGTVAVLLGSGNFNRSLYANMEDWILYTGPMASSLSAAVICTARSVQTGSGKNVDADSMAEEARRCISTWPAMPPVNGFTLEFAPTQGAAFHQRLLAAIETADAIDVAAQALEDPDLVKALLDNKAATVRVIADDDWYWALRKRADYYTASYEKLKWVQQLPKASVRFLQTNHANVGGVGNTLHTRMIAVTKAGTRTVFTGSAHFRPGSLTRNVEHLLTVTDPSATQLYRDFLDALWNSGVSWEDMPLVDVPVVIKQ